jgi:antitoxin component YwqK of YwqJK toxin-antitoxin module
MYHENGQLLHIGNYVNNKNEGEHKWYHENGKIELSWVYSGGELFNALESRDRNGRKLYTGTLKDGTGTAYIYHPNGVIEAIYIMDEGKRLWVVHEQNIKGEPRKEPSTLNNGNGQIYSYVNGTDIISFKEEVKEGVF